MAELHHQGKDIGRSDYHHWLEHHHPHAAAAKLAQVISTGDYTCADFIASGAAPGPLGSLMEWAKERLFRRKY
jgi:hypothetical protein